MRSYQRHKASMEQRALVERRKKLVERYSPLIRKVARRIMRRLPSGSDEIEPDDLFSAGIIGLFEAEGRYLPETGKPFETFAEFRIKGAMLDELRRRDFMPRRLRVKANKLTKIEKNLRAALQRDPTDEEVAAKMDLSTGELSKLRDDIAPYHFVDSDAEEISLTSSTPSPFSALSDKQDKVLLVQALKALPEREQLILDLYFNHELTLKEIAHVLDLTIGRISQLKTASLRKLRTILSEAHQPRERLAV